MLSLAKYFPITDPTLIFFVVLLIILSAPIIMGRLRIPHIIGMVLAGVLVGKYGLNILERDASFRIFGAVGLYYIMFLAGLEMDLGGLKKNQLRIIVFGILTFLTPFLLTLFFSLCLLGYSLQGSLLLGCIMASNTLVAYPIVTRYALQRHNSVTISVGSSLLSMFVALVATAVIANTLRKNNSAAFWMWFVLKLGLFTGGMIYFVPRLTRWFLRRYSDAVMQFIFVLSIVFFSAAMSDAIGLEGIYGAFLAGLILNRFIPHVSALMNRIEFAGNALFIPYFLIGVGMLINVRLLFHGGNILWVVGCIVLTGTLGKAAAAYITGLLFKLPLNTAHMMFGLTSAHAAGAIAMATVGLSLQLPSGQRLFDNEVLNGIVIMILVTCIISSVVTENTAKRIRLQEKDEDEPATFQGDDEKIVLPVKYPEYADNLLSLAIMMRNAKLKRGIIALNVVYDDYHAAANQERGKELLEHLQGIAAAHDVPMITQVRLATNIANGIKHAFKEYAASEIVMGLHFHNDISRRFWGEFTQSLYNGLPRQIIIARILQPLSTIRRIQVAVPSRAEFELGFRRWVERLARLAGNLECRIQFHGRKDSLALINEYIQNKHPSVRAEYVLMGHWNELPTLATEVKDDHLFVIVTARKGTISYKTAMERLPQEVTQFCKGKSLMIIFPDQYEQPMDQMTFAQPQHTEERSAYEAVGEWLKKHKRH